MVTEQLSLHIAWWSRVARSFLSRKQQRQAIEHGLHLFVILFRPESELTSGKILPLE